MSFCLSVCFSRYSHSHSPCLTSSLSLSIPFPSLTRNLSPFVSLTTFPLFHSSLSLSLSSLSHLPPVPHFLSYPVGFFTLSLPHFLSYCLSRPVSFACFFSVFDLPFSLRPCISFALHRPAICPCSCYILLSCRLPTSCSATALSVHFSSFPSVVTHQEHALADVVKRWQLDVCLAAADAAAAASAAATAQSGTRVVKSWA